MESDAFRRPAFVGENGCIRKIDCVMDAIEFSEEWPVEKRGLLHAAATEACYAAYDGRKPLEGAYKAFTAWARKIGVYEDVPPARPWMTGPKISNANLS
ncbi:conserved hypothetical protein [Mesorhizobium sp. SOD10]|nr:conserved hypothetical protein [Mesorhizobium sp. SOD10]